MLFSPSVILEKVQNDFTTVNESFSGFPDSGSLWEECIRTVKDAALMNHIIFNNDVMEIPPVRTFLKASRVLDGGFNSYQKKALNAFWGFVFREIFFYGGQEDNAGVNVMGIRKASRFTNPPSEIIVGDLDEASGKIVIPVPRQKLRMNLAEPGKATVHPVPELHRNEGTRLDDRRIDDRRIDDRRIHDQRVDDQRVDDQRVDDQRMEDRRVEGQRIADQSTEDQRIAEQRISEQRIENQRDADRMVEAQRLEEQRLAEQRIEKERLAESGSEEPGIEEKRIEELRIKEPRV